VLDRTLKDKPTKYKPIARDSVGVVPYVNDTKIMPLENYRKLNLKQFRLEGQIHNPVAI
jgi:hypothetical protein